MDMTINQATFEPPKKKKGGCLKWGAIIFGGLVGIGVVVNLAGGGETSTSTTTTKSETVSTGAAADTTAQETSPIQMDTPKNTEENKKQEEKASANDLPREYKNALKMAERYLKTSSFSKAKLYQQLTSEYGSKFPADAAQYAIDNVQADWNAEALEAAKSYQKISPMSDSELYDQLTSEYGSGFTPEEAQYAVDNLDK